MKFDKETTDKLLELYNKGEGSSIAEICVELDKPERSVIAKLASLGVYQKKPYLNKRGELPVKKEDYIEQLATLLGKDISLLDSLEKANKSVLIMLVNALSK